MLTVERSLPAEQVAAAVDAVAGHPARLRALSAAVSGDPDALRAGAPPLVGRLVAELLARGSTSLTLPACAGCGRTGWPLSATDGGGMCQRCAHHQRSTSCTQCGVVKPVAGRTDDGKPICERCRRRCRGHRRCGVCGNTASIALRSTSDGQPDVCVNCYRLPEAVCSRCGRRGPCNFTGGDRPICKTCAPRATACCAHCGQHRPPAARWAEGPVCDPCYTAALRRRGTCTGCGQLRRLVAPAGLAASICADCAGLPASHSCADCGIEDKLFERGRCARCSLRRRATRLLAGGAGEVPAELAEVFTAIVAAANPRSALNWLRTGAGAGVLAELAAGRLAASHDALDAHPRRRAADYLRHMLIAGGVLPGRDEELARTQRWAADLLASIDNPVDRRLVQAYATWRVLRRLRRRAEHNPHPRTYTRHARLRIGAAVRFLAWLAERETTLGKASQADLDAWLATGPAAYDIRDFLAWAAEHRHCRPLNVPGRDRRDGPATGQDQRWAALARLLHDDSLDLTDRVAGALLLCYGQQLSRIAAMTRQQVTRRDDRVFLHLGRDEIAVPEPLAGLLGDLLDHGRRYIGVGSPATTPWLFPGLLPGQPITPARLGARLRTLGVRAQASRRATLLQLAATMPAAVLADLLHLAPTTAVRWVTQAGGDWSRYAAELARERVHQP